MRCCHLWGVAGFVGHVEWARHDAGSDFVGVFESAPPLASKLACGQLPCGDAGGGREEVLGVI